MCRRSGKQYGAEQIVIDASEEIRKGRQEPTYRELAEALIAVESELVPGYVQVLPDETVEHIKALNARVPVQKDII